MEVYSGMLQIMLICHEGTQKSLLHTKFARKPSKSGAGLSLSLFIFVSLKGLWYISLKIALLADWLGALGEGTFAKGLGKKADGNDKGFFTISSFLRKIFL